MKLFNSKWQWDNPWNFVFRWLFSSKCNWPTLSNNCLNLCSKPQGLGTHPRASLRKDGLYRCVSQEAPRANPVGVCDEGARDDGEDENGPHKSQETEVAGGRARTKGIICVRVKLLGLLTSLYFRLIDDTTHFPWIKADIFNRQTCTWIVILPL